MKKIITLLLTLTTLSVFGQTNSKSDSVLLVKPIHQLRIYEIPKENKQNFHERFANHAYRIMKKYGFNIVAMWESDYKEKVEFVYLLEWANEDSMKIAWSNFLEDQEWKDIKSVTGKEHGKFVSSIEDRTLRLTKYSPQVTLKKN